MPLHGTMVQAGEESYLIVRVGRRWCKARERMSYPIGLGRWERGPGTLLVSSASHRRRGSCAVGRMVAKRRRRCKKLTGVPVFHFQFMVAFWSCGIRGRGGIRGFPAFESSASKHGSPQHDAFGCPVHQGDTSRDRGGSTHWPSSPERNSPFANDLWVIAAVPSVVVLRCTATPRLPTRYEGVPKHVAAKFKAPPRAGFSSTG